MKAIVNANVIMRDYVIPDGAILFDEEKIIKVGKAKDVIIPSGAEIIDVGNEYVGPGLIDIHTHAADNKWIFEEPEYTSQFMLKHGVTGVLPALYYNLNKEQYIKAIDDILTEYKGKI